ncbi:DUF2019 domain-containing protein [Nitratireductor mangrovi]|uniref:DUF2019 domain-containing protein n=1 Tax=Nitratireductor mangrovi TaxID=2599600 RepID=A0A6H0DX68_9HYPH|nr:DUF2019 domain-containing protein [Nitratireductor mangrovi]QIS94660.1 DUF2019 domain-containing protein [Nitratireductor mangrovi]
MTRLNNTPLDTLISSFIEIGVAQADALDAFDTRRFNRLYDREDEIVNELRARPGDQRRVLLTLFNHPNMQVRLNAAKSTLAVAPQEARAQLRAIQESQRFPQAGDAGMSLWNLEKGYFRPE